MSGPFARWAIWALRCCLRLIPLNENCRKRSFDVLCGASCPHCWPLYCSRSNWILRSIQSPREPRRRWRCDHCLTRNSGLCRKLRFHSRLPDSVLHTSIRAARQRRSRHEFLHGASLLGESTDWMHTELTAVDTGNCDAAPAEVRSAISNLSIFRSASVSSVAQSPLPSIWFRGTSQIRRSMALDRLPLRHRVCSHRSVPRRL